MKCSLSDTPYQWKDGEAWNVGKLVMAGTRIVARIGIQDRQDMLAKDMAQVSHSHTGELEFVEWGKLSPYPASPIPEPGSTPSNPSRLKVEGLHQITF